MTFEDHFGKPRGILDRLLFPSLRVAYAAGRADERRAWFSKGLHDGGHLTISAGGTLLTDGKAHK